MKNTVLTIQKKLLLSILASLLLIFGLLITSVYFSTEHYLKEELQKQVDANLKGMQVISDNYKANALAHAKHLAANPAIIDGIKTKNREALLDTTIGLIEDASLDYLVLTDESGNVLIRTHEPDAIPIDNISSQENIAMALKGNPVVSLEHCKIVDLTIRGTAPIIDQNTGRIIGSILTGYVFSESNIVDMAKQIFNSEFAIYSFNEKVTTTIDGNQNEYIQNENPIYQNVLIKGQVVIQQENIFGTSYMAGYAPLKNYSNEIVGMIKTAVPFNLIGELKSVILKNSLIFSFFILIITTILGYSFIKKAKSAELQRKNYEQQIENSAQQLRQITRALGEGIYVVNRKGLLTFMNPEAERLLQWTEEELIGKDVHESIHYKRLDGSTFYKADCKALSTIKSGNTYRVEDDAFIRKDGTFFPVSYVSAPLTSNGEIIGSVTAFQDITERKKIAEQLQHEAYYDKLTNCPNRILFEKLFAEAIANAKQTSKTLAILFVDFDRFKLINDTFGHDYGDIALQYFSKRIQEVIGAENILSRFGGDEFTILLQSENLNETMTKDIASKIIQSMKEPMYLKEQKIKVTCSIGISLYPEHGLELSDLLKKADSALLRVKNHGRNMCVTYSPELDSYNSERIVLESNLPKALEQNEFSLYYQPILDSKTESVVSMEALIRWNHPEMGMISPVAFIPIAEENGLIIPITEWVLFTACRDTKKWQENGHPNLKISVNITSTHFHHPDFIDMILRVLNETKLDPTYLNLEITESVCMYNIDYVIQTLEKLHSLGIKLSIDDSGTGYSSLTYLKQIPFNILKIDRTFIKNIADLKQDTLTSTIITMAHNLNMKVVAEGVETEEQRSYLEQYGCDYMQGYLFSKPLPAKEIEEKLNRLILQK